jgi:integrase
MSRDVININVLKENRVRKLADGMIAPAKEHFEEELAIDHSADPIKDLHDINRISKYLIEHGRYRDNMLFIVGINFGLRVSDLRVLRFSNLINDNLTFKDTFPVFEKKTRNTRKKKKNRYITVNNAVVDAVTLFLEHTDGISLSDYMFKATSNRGKNLGKPLAIQSINRILTDLANELHLNIKMSSHSLRKTFCYHQMVMSNNDPRKLLLLQKMLNHSSPAMTLEYIGITGEEIEEAYKKLNLGSLTENYLVDSTIMEYGAADDEPETTEIINKPQEYAIKFPQAITNTEQPSNTVYS